MAPSSKSAKARTNWAGRSNSIRTAQRSNASRSAAPSVSGRSSTSHRSSAGSLHGTGRQRSVSTAIRANTARSGSVATNATSAARARATAPRANTARSGSVTTNATSAARARSEAAFESVHDSSEADVDYLSEVIMVVNLAKRNTVGCAYYVARAEKLYFMEEVKLGGPEVIESRKFAQVVSAHTLTSHSQAIH